MLFEYYTSYFDNMETGDFLRKNITGKTQIKSIKAETTANAERYSHHGKNSPPDNPPVSEEIIIGSPINKKAIPTEKIKSAKPSYFVIVYHNGFTLY